MSDAGVTIKGGARVFFSSTLAINQARFSPHSAPDFISRARALARLPYARVNSPSPSLSLLRDD